MSRPRKMRKICGLPNHKKFGPLGGRGLDEQNYINMTVDEYEVIRLIDLEGLTQQEAADQMKVARTTVQGIYQEARKKLAKSLINGHTLIIGGGDYVLCDGEDLGTESGCGAGCNRRRNQRLFNGRGNR